MVNNTNLSNDQTTSSIQNWIAETKQNNIQNNFSRNLESINAIANHDFKMSTLDKEFKDIGVYSTNFSTFNNFNFCQYVDFSGKPGTLNKSPLVF